MKKTIFTLLSIFLIFVFTGNTYGATTGANKLYEAFSQRWIGVDPNNGRAYWEPDSPISNISVTEYRKLASYTTVAKIYAHAGYNSVESAAKDEVDSQGALTGRKYFDTLEDAEAALYNWPKQLEAVVRAYAPSNTPPATLTKNVSLIQQYFEVTAGPVDANGDYKSSCVDMELDHIPAQHTNVSKILNSKGNVVKVSNKAGQMLVLPTMIQNHRRFLVYNPAKPNKPFEVIQGMTSNTGTPIRTTGGEIGYPVFNEEANGKLNAKLDANNKADTSGPNGSKNFIAASTTQAELQNSASAKFTDLEKEQLKQAFTISVNVIDSRRAVEEGDAWIRANIANLDIDNINNAELIKAIHAGHDRTGAIKRSLQAMIELGSYDNATGSDRATLNTALGQMKPKTKEMIEHLSLGGDMPTGIDQKTKDALANMQGSILAKYGSFCN